MGPRRSSGGSGVFVGAAGYNNNHNSMNHNAGSMGGDRGRPLNSSSHQTPLRARSDSNNSAAANNARGTGGGRMGAVAGAFGQQQHLHGYGGGIAPLHTAAFAEENEFYNDYVNTGVRGSPRSATVNNNGAGGFGRTPSRTTNNASLQRASASFRTRSNSNNNNNNNANNSAAKNGDQQQKNQQQMHYAQNASANGHGSNGRGPNNTNNSNSNDHHRALHLQDLSIAAPSSYHHGGHSQHGTPHRSGIVAGDPRNPITPTSPHYNQQSVNQHINEHNHHSASGLCTRVNSSGCSSVADVAGLAAAPHSAVSSPLFANGNGKRDDMQKSASAAAIGFESVAHCHSEELEELEVPPAVTVSGPLRNVRKILPVDESAASRAAHCAAAATLVMMGASEAETARELCPAAGTAHRIFESREALRQIGGLVHDTLTVQQRLAIASSCRSAAAAAAAELEASERGVVGESSEVAGHHEGTTVIQIMGASSPDAQHGSLLTSPAQITSTTALLGGTLANGEAVYSDEEVV